MTWFELLLFVHIAVAIIWVGGGLMMQFFGVRASMSGDPRRFGELGEDIEWIANRVFIPASLAAFVTRDPARGRVRLLRFRRRLDRDGALAVRDDLPRRAPVHRPGVRVASGS